MDDGEDEDHEDIELVVKELAALRKVCEFTFFFSFKFSFILATPSDENVSLSCTTLFQAKKCPTLLVFST